MTEFREAGSPIGVGLSGRFGANEDVSPSVAAERAADTTLAESFPASDPPSWTHAIARPGAEPRGRAATETTRSAHPGSGGRPGPTAAAEPERHPFLVGLVALAGVTGVVLTVPIVILLAGMPVVLLVHVVMAAIGWLGGLFFG